MGAVSTLVLVRGSSSPSGCLWREAASLARALGGDASELGRALDALSRGEGSDARLDETTVHTTLQRLLASCTLDAVAFGNAKSLALTMELCELDAVLGADVLRLVGTLDAGLVRPWAPGGGGYGEGLRGALDREGCRRVSEALSRLDLDRGAMDPAGVLETAGDDDARPLRILAAMARRAVSHDASLVHGRDLPLDHVGRWERGVFRRALGGS